MKVLFFAVAIRFALVTLDGKFATHAFTSSASRVLPSRESSVTGNPRSADDNSKRYHHMGDLDHDILPEPKDDDKIYSNTLRNNNNKEEQEDTGDSGVVVVFDDAAVALDDAAWDMAMKSIMALFVALAFAFGGGGLFKPRPVLAVEPMDFSRSRCSAEVVLVVTRERIATTAIPHLEEFASPPSSLP